MCLPRTQQGLIGSIWFLGWVLTLPFIPRLADIYGRRRLVCFAPACYLLLWYALFQCESFRGIMVIALCFGLLTSIQVNVGYIYMVELFPMRAQAFFGTLWMVFEASVALIASLYF